jgi:hypothetical protein
LSESDHILRDLPEISYANTFPKAEAQRNLTNLLVREAQIIVEAEVIKALTSIFLLKIKNFISK